MSELEPKKVVASFDSASVLHAATVHALEHRDFPHLGNPAPLAWLTRLGGRLPWPVLRQIYSRIGGAEGIPPERLGDVDLDDVATSFAEAYPERDYPGLIIGSSNGAMTHLAAAVGMPWLPQTVLVPVHHVGDPNRPDEAAEFGAKVAPALTDRNPDTVLHQMHDAAQDELMSARMAYFRTKWTALPAAYRRMIERLPDGAPVFLVDDTSTWPVTRISERHVFQNGGRGGLTPEEYLARPHALAVDDRAPEAEWGAEPTFVAAVTEACERTGHPVVHVRTDGPQGLAHPVAVLLREWERERGGSGSRLLVPSFVIVDPWWTVTNGRVPFWTYFSVQEALRSLNEHLDAVEPYERIDILMFQHGANSPGIATPSEWEQAAYDHGAEPHLVGLREDAAPHDIGAMGRYGPALRHEHPDPGFVFAPLPVERAVAALSS